MRVEVADDVEDEDEEVAKCVALNNEDFDSFAAYLAQIAVSKQGAIPPRRR